MEQPWFWNHSHCWTDFPLQVMPDSTYGESNALSERTSKRSVYFNILLVYYMAELSFYFSLGCTLLIDNKRKDFNEQIIHHVATVSLLSLSYVCNFTRIGTLVMWCHDVSDIFLESAKLCVYAKPTIAKVPVADVLFALFGIIFFVR